MQVTLLGTGTSQGVPMIAQPPNPIDWENTKNWRTRSSVHVVMDGLHIQVDASPEFRLQCLNNKITWTDFFILTHGHADHIAGMDDLRRFCDLREGKALPVYSTPEGLARVRSMFPYAISNQPKNKGYPAFSLKNMPSRWILPEGTVESTLLEHGETHTLGLVFLEKSSGKKFSYYTDCKTVNVQQIEKARHSDLLVLDALRLQTHRSHLSIDEAIAIAVEIDAKNTYLTHLSSELDHQSTESYLPKNIYLGYDGLSVIL